VIACQQFESCPPMLSIGPMKVLVVFLRDLGLSSILSSQMHSLPGRLLTHTFTYVPQVALRISSSQTAVREANPAGNVHCPQALNLALQVWVC